MVQLALLCLIVISFSASSHAQSDALLREAWSIVNEHFYDPEFNGVDWPAMLERYEPLAREVQSREEHAQIINAMLAELKTSHTSYHVPTDQAYYELLDIYRFALGDAFERAVPDGKVRYEGIGIVTVQRDGRTFVRDVLDGLPGAEAGLKVGDEIVSVNGERFHPIESFRGRAGEVVEMMVRRTADGEPFTVAVTPIWIEPQQAFAHAQRSSATIVEHGGVRIGYVRVRSYASREFQELLVELVTGEGALAGADSLVLDLRCGWGGANPDYVNLFNTDVPALSFRPRGGKWNVLDMQWRKPVVLLVDETVRSGKEIITHAFKTRGIGPVVGTTTSGAVVGGRPFLLSDNSLLIVAVMDVRVDDQRLEGIGVEPDIHVAFPLEYANGNDPQLQRAIEVAADEVRRQASSDRGGNDPAG